MAADAATRGFHDNEVWVWLMPNARTRARVQRRTYRSQVKRVFVKRRTGWTTRAGTGTALWLPPDNRKTTLAESLAEAIAFMPEGLPRIGKARRLEAAMEANTPKEPHWYLSLLSVEPESQGKGHGSALIKPGLEAADRQGSGCYLETQRESNIPFYSRFGFELTGKIWIDDELPLWLMWRDAR